MRDRLQAPKRSFFDFLFSLDLAQIWPYVRLHCIGASGWCNDVCNCIVLGILFILYDIVLCRDRGSEPGEAGGPANTIQCNTISGESERQYNTMQYMGTQKKAPLAGGNTIQASASRIGSQAWIYSSIAHNRNSRSHHL